MAGAGYGGQAPRKLTGLLFFVAISLLQNSTAMSHFSVSVTFLGMPSRIYLEEHGPVHWMIVSVLIDGNENNAQVPLFLEFWVKWDLDEPALIQRQQIDLPLPRKIQATMGIDWAGTMALKAFVKEAGAPDGMAGTAMAEALVNVISLPAPQYVAARRIQGQSIHVIDATGAEAQGIASTAAALYAGTEKIKYGEIVHAFKIDMPISEPHIDHESEIYVTLQCVGDHYNCKDRGYFAFGVRRRVVDETVHVDLSAASRVASDLWAHGPPRRLSSWIAQGVCAAWEPIVDLSLRPWRRFGAKIREDQVASLERTSTKVCWQRIRIISNRLYVDQPEVDKYARRQWEEHDKWYTKVLVETLLALLQRFIVPDVDVCVSEEVPQVLKGENKPSLAMTISEAHMDILVPDFFFRYWSLNTGAVPHHWYKPPQDWSEYSATTAPPWHLRTAKVWWRGTVSSWHMSSRGYLMRLAVDHPHLIDAKPLRVVGEALNESWDGVETLLTAVKEGGKGTKTDSKEQFDFKYLLSTHGPHNEWSNRFRALLSTGALVFKQDASLKEFWEFDLRAWEHFVPVSADLSDIVEKVEWAIENDGEAHRIAQNGFEFVRERLRPQRVACYWAHLLTGYGELLAYTPAPTPNSSEYMNLAAHLGA